MREVLDAAKGVAEFTSLLDGAFDLPAGTTNTVLLLATASGGLKFGRVLSVWTAVKIFKAGQYFVTSVREAFRNEVHPAVSRILAHLDDEKAEFTVYPTHVLKANDIHVRLDDSDHRVNGLWIQKEGQVTSVSLWQDFTNAERDLIAAKVKKRVAWVKERDRQIRLAGVPLVPTEAPKPVLSVYDPDMLRAYGACYEPVMGRSASADKDGNCVGR